MNPNIIKYFESEGMALGQDCPNLSNNHVDVPKPLLPFVKECLEYLSYNWGNIYIENFQNGKDIDCTYGIAPYLSYVKHAILEGLITDRKSFIHFMSAQLSIEVEIRVRIRV